MKMWLKILAAVLLLCGVVACTPTPSGPIAQATPEVTIQGDTPGREEVQTFELDNCGGKADAKRIEGRTQSVDVTISAEIASEIGASVEVLSAEVEAAVGAAITRGSQQNTAIELVAPPDTRMVFELVWIGNERIGVVQNIRNSDVPIAFRSFSPTDFRIKSQSDIGCPGSTAPQVVFNPTPTIPSSITDVVEPTSISVVESITTVNPYRERFITNIGTGPLAEIQFSDGMAEYSDATLAANHGRIQQMNTLNTPTGCGIAQYASERIWFGSTRVTKILINGRVIAEYDQPTFRASHGGIFDWAVSLGDEICVELSPGLEYHIVIGPDVDIHYDSYCYRDHC